jgi:hypothetical protein
MLDHEGNQKGMRLSCHKREFCMMGDQSVPMTVWMRCLVGVRHGPQKLQPRRKLQSHDWNTMQGTWVSHDHASDHYVESWNRVTVGCSNLQITVTIRMFKRWFRVSNSHDFHVRITHALHRSLSDNLYVSCRWDKYQTHIHCEISTSGHDMTWPVHVKSYGAQNVKSTVVISQPSNFCGVVGWGWFCPCLIAHWTQFSDEKIHP